MKLTKGAAVLVIVLEALATGTILFYIWSRFPVNHTGFDIRAAYLLPVMGTALCIYQLARAPRWIIRAALAFNLLFAAWIYVIDTQNILISYETWIERGMPISPLEN